jgi:TRAP-type C4-dicarboxylate transport system permease small subunit
VSKLLVHVVKGIQWLTGMLFLGLFLLNILRIALRYFLGVSWLWVPDFSRLLFIWIVFLGTSVLYARKEHLVMDYFVEKMTDANRTKLRLIIDIFLALFLIILGIKGLEISKVRMRIPFDTWDFPTGYAYAAVPVCSMVMLVITIDRFMKYVRERRKS